MNIEPELIEEITSSIGRIAHAITPLDAAAGEDAAGGVISSLTESVMGTTAGLHAIALAIDDLPGNLRDTLEHVEVEHISDAIRHCFVSPNVSDSNMEPANIVDAIANMANAFWKIANNNERGN